MDTGRILAISWRIIQTMLRDRRTIGLIILAPILITWLVTVGLTADTTTEIIIVDHADDPQSHALINSLWQNDDLTLTYAGDENTARRLVRDGPAEAIVVVEPDHMVRLVADNTNHWSGRTTSMVLGSLGDGENVQVENVLARHFDRTDQLAPIILGFIVFFLTFINSAVVFLREREGTMERLMSTPLLNRELVLGYTIGFSFFAILQSTVLLAFAIWALNINTYGSLTLVYLILVIVAVGSLGLGMFCSSFAQTEFQIFQMIPIIITPQFIVSGILVPIRDLPWYLQWLSPLLPMTHTIEALNKVMIRGLGLESLAWEMTYLVFFALLMLALTTATLTRKGA